MARLFSKDYHVQSATWYFNQAIIVLSDGDLEYWRSVDENGLSHLRFFPTPEVKRHFSEHVDVVYDPSQEQIVAHNCSECGDSPSCRHYLSVLRYAYHHLSTDILDTPAVETNLKEDLRMSEDWAAILAEASLEIEGLYNPKMPTVRFYYSRFAQIDIPQLIKHIQGSGQEVEYDKDVYQRNIQAFSNPRLSFLEWLYANRAAQSTKYGYISLNKSFLSLVFDRLGLCGDFVRIKETGDPLQIHHKPYPLSLRIEPVGKNSYVMRPVIVDEISTWAVGYPTWLLLQNQAYPVWLPLTDEKIRQLMDNQLILSLKDLVYYRTVVYHELRRHDIYLDFDEQIQLPYIVDEEPRISLELKKMGEMVIMEGWLRYPAGEQVPLSVTRFNSSLVRSDFQKYDESGNGWFYLAPAVFERSKELMSRFPQADRSRVEEFSQIAFEGDTAIMDLRQKLVKMDDADWDVLVSEELSELFIQKIVLDVEISASRNEEIDWFTYDVRYSYRDFSFTHEELRKFFQSGQDYLHTQEGRTLFISNPEIFHEMEHIISRSEAYKDSVYRARMSELPYLHKLLKDRPAIRMMQDSWLNQMAIDLQRRSLEVVTPLPINLQSVLRSYQKAGVAWLQMLQHYGLNGILADEMGLGKTIQALSVLMNTPEGKTSLLICPKTLLYNWVAEIAKFHTNISYLVLEGGKDIRTQMLKQPNVKLLLVPYSLVLNDLALLSQIQFHYIVLDEAQNIKNVSAQRTAAIKKLKSEHRMALSGTPVENNLTELWSIYDFLMPGYLYSLKKFRNIFMLAEDEAQAQQRLHRMVAPFMLRRIKKDVLLELPDKQEQISWCKLGTVQEKAYLQVLEMVNKQLFPAGKSGAINYIHILSALTKLRQICNHPHLVNPDIKAVPETSTKLEQLLELVQDSLASGHKILVFSQFVTMLEIIRKSFDQIGLDYSYLDGKTKNRMAVVQEFETNPEKRVFLISLKTGGTGLNLTSADTVILYDPWWNPMGENQAIDRVHRIGQTKKVQVFRLISKGTVEEKILALQQNKLAMFDAVVSGGQQLLSNLTGEQLKELFTY